eukprot:CAMPEP_0169211200 /NCGR_PEP_ID=MMETSP1016-20121227/15622_1 /TAXON_ID=342587 /ORGANISM="Karlodinium micrum, Strain CCMP2283" /LENGTH=146 /DNA_ID=CAMNT_0009288793 /DNA_START=159 /DNA_END=599 /DNA_ORIENTATION=-
MIAHGSDDIQHLFNAEDETATSSAPLSPHTRGSGTNPWRENKTLALRAEIELMTTGALIAKALSMGIGKDEFEEIEVKEDLIELILAAERRRLREIGSIVYDGTSHNNGSIHDKIVGERTSRAIEMNPPPWLPQSCEFTRTVFLET